MKKLVGVKTEIPNRMTPLPFPGAYPTRWDIGASWTDASGVERTFRYVGKPNTAIVKWLRGKISPRYKGVLIFKEFDRGGSFKYIAGTMPFGGDFPYYDANSKLDTFYYPDCQNDVYMIQMWNTPFNRVRLMHKGKGYVTYWKHRNLFQDHIGLLRGHKAWLGKSGLKLK